MAMTINQTDALLVIDVQNDFCPGGSLAIGGGDMVVPVINRLAQRFTAVVATQDWHPAGHFSFASSHPGRQPFDVVQCRYGEQRLWPDHCVQGTRGAEFHQGLHLPQCQLVIRKGFRPDLDSYSAFAENDRATLTGLAGYLRERGIARIFLTGLATDYCVRWSAEDAQRSGFTAIVIEDACRAIASGEAYDEVIAGLRKSGIGVVTSEEVEV